MSDLLSNAQLAEKLEVRPAPRITMEFIKQRIMSYGFMRMDNLGSPTVTVCNIIIDNGFSVRGESACVNEANYDKAIGEKLAYEDAFKKLWPLFGFMLAEDNLRSKT